MTFYSFNTSLLNKSIFYFIIFTKEIFFPALIINQQIRMISEESYDTGDWSNDDDNSALITEINYIWKYIKIENFFFFLSI